MQTTKNLKNRFRTVAKIECRQICPACPVTLERAVFVYDYELGNKLIQFVLRNTGERPVTGAVVRFRCYDGAGNCLYPGSTPDCGITYSGLDCPPGEYFADRRAVKLWSYDIVNYEAWVTQVMYADGTSEDFSPEDYLERPSRALLSSLLEPGEEKALLRAWGKAARCVPIDIGEGLWMCSCGRVCLNEICRDCGAARTDRAPYFGSAATLAYARSLARRRSVLRAGIGAAAALCVAGALGGGIYYAARVAYPAATARVTDQFLAEARYDEALAFTRKRKDSGQQARVLAAAVDAELAAHDYAGALVYDSLLAEPDPERIYRAAADDAMAGMSAKTVDFTAAGYGLLTGDEALYDDLIHALISYCEENQLYRQAARYTRMLHDMEDEALAAVFDDAIAESMARESYDEAISWAEQHPDGSRYTEVLEVVFNHYFAVGDLESALAFAVRYGEETDYLDRVRAAADEQFIAKHITEFYFNAMTTTERRAFNASRLAIAKEVAYIDGSGTVRGLKDVSWAGAVSVAMNEFHTLCLFSSGKVAATGSTAYGRCSVSSWEDIVDIAAGERHSVGLKSNGQVSAVGDNSEGQCDVSSWRAIISVAAGKYHTVGLRTDGTVRAVGANGSGQCEVEGYADIIAVAAGDWTTVLLHRDGSVTVLGNTALGVAEANSWTDIVAIAAGSSHVLGLRADGTVLMAGQPSFGSAGTVDDWTDVVEIAAGSVCVAGLRADGTLYLSGDGKPAVN